MSPRANSAPLFDAGIVQTAAIDAVRKLSPRKLVRNPKIRDEVLEDAAAFAGVGFSAHLGGTTAASFSGN